MESNIRIARAQPHAPAPRPGGALAGPPRRLRTLALSLVSMTAVLLPAATLRAIPLFTPQPLTVGVSLAGGVAREDSHTYSKPLSRPAFAARAARPSSTIYPLARHLRGGQAAEPQVQQQGGIEEEEEEEEEELPGEFPSEQARLKRESINEEMVGAMEQQEEERENQIEAREAPPKNRPMVFSYVKIPADDDEPVTEHSIRIPDNARFEFSDVLFRALRDYYDVGKKVDKKELLRAWGANMGAMPQAEMMTSVATVELFWLVLPSKENNYTQINFYLDECGKLKNLPPNNRATQLANLAGRGSGDCFNGDVFVGRMSEEGNRGFETDDAPHDASMYNVNFTIADMDKSSPWLRKAYLQNYQHSVKMQQFTDKMKEKGVKVINNNQNKADPEQMKKKCPHFWWIQNRDEVELNVRVGRATTADAIKVDFGMEQVRLYVYGRQDLDLRLFNKIVPDESTWLILKTHNERKGRDHHDDISRGGQGNRKGEEEEEEEGVVQITMVKNIDTIWNSLEIGIKSASEYLFQQNDEIVRFMLKIPTSLEFDRRDVVVDTKEKSMTVYIKTQNYCEISELWETIKPEQTEFEEEEIEGKKVLSIILVKAKRGIMWDQVRKPQENENPNATTMVEDKDKIEAYFNKKDQIG